MMEQHICTTCGGRGHDAGVCPTGKEGEIEDKTVGDKGVPVW